MSCASLNAAESDRLPQSSVLTQKNASAPAAPQQKAKYGERKFTPVELDSELSRLQLACADKPEAFNKTRQFYNALSAQGARVRDAAVTDRAMRHFVFGGIGAAQGTPSPKLASSKTVQRLVGRLIKAQLAVRCGEKETLGIYLKSLEVRCDPQGKPGIFGKMDQAHRDRKAANSRAYRGRQKPSIGQICPKPRKKYATECISQPIVATDSGASPLLKEYTPPLRGEAAPNHESKNDIFEPLPTTSYDHKSSLIHSEAMASLNITEADLDIEANPAVSGWETVKKDDLKEDRLAKSQHDLQDIQTDSLARSESAMREIHADKAASQAALAVLGNHHHKPLHAQSPLNLMRLRQAMTDSQRAYASHPHAQAKALVPAVQRLAVVQRLIVAQRGVPADARDFDRLKQAFPLFAQLDTALAQRVNASADLWLYEAERISQLKTGTVQDPARLLTYRAQRWARCM